MEVRFPRGGSKIENPVLRTNMLRGRRKGDPNINVVGIKDDPIVVYLKSPSGPLILMVT